MKILRMVLGNSIHMVNKGFSRFMFRFVLAFLLSINYVLVSAQEKPQTVGNEQTTVQISLADLAKQASEAIMETRQLKERLIQNQVLYRMNKEVDSLVNVIDSQIKEDKKSEGNAPEIRKVRASLIFLRQKNSLIVDKKEDLERLLDNLQKNKNMLSSHLDYWKKVKVIIKKKRWGKSTENQANEVITLLSGTVYAVNKLINTDIGMIRKLSELELAVDTRMAFLNKMLQKRQAEILSEKQPSFFDLDFHDLRNFHLSKALSKFYSSDIQNLLKYFANHIEALIFHIFLMIALIVVFLRLSKTPLSLETGMGKGYKKRLKELLSRPISTALIIGFFASAIIYPNRPLIFRDLVILLILLPITYLLKSIVRKRFYVFIYALALTLLAVLIYSYIPVSSIYSRLLLLFISLIELLASVYFIIVFKKEKERQERFGKLFLFLSYGILVFVSIGFLANIFGKVMLAKYLLFSITEIVLVVFIVLVTAVMINGIMVTFITSRVAGKSQFIKKNKTDIIKKSTQFVNVIALVILIHYVLSILGWETSFLSALGEWFGREYQLGSITFSWGRFFIFLFIIWFSIFIGRIVRDVLEDDILNKVKMEEGLPHTIATMARYALITIGFLLAFSALGMPMSDLAIMFSAFGVGIGFGLQNIFNNLVSGLILLFERPIKIGDTIEVGDLTGKVLSIGIRASNIRTFDGAEIIVPNGNFISNEVINWTLSDQRRRIEIMVNVSYNTDPQKVKEVLLDLLMAHADVAKDPAPGVYFIDMGKSALTFRVLFWTYQYGKWYSIRSNMMYEVFSTLKKAGIEIPYQQLDVHLRPNKNDGNTVTDT